MRAYAAGGVWISRAAARPESIHEVGRLGIGRHACLAEHRRLPSADPSPERFIATQLLGTLAAPALLVSVQPNVGVENGGGAVRQR